MKIYANRIPAEGYQEHVAYDPKALDVDRFDVRVEHPIEVSAFITKADRNVLVRAKIQGVATFGCARCLTPFEAPIEADATLSYQVAPTATLDITGDLRQELILAYPMIPVCHPGCKGLCPACGQNLNAETCPHEAQQKGT